MTRKNSYTYKDLIECAHGRLFGPGNAQLPLPPMLMFDRITKISEEGGEYGKGEMIAEMDVKPDLWFFKCHFEGDPVMPGCLGLDAMWQMVGFFLGWVGGLGKGRALGVGEVKFTATVALSPGQIIQVPDGRAGVVAGARDLAIGDPVTAYVAGVFEIPKASATVFAVGVQAEWDDTANLALTTLGDFVVGEVIEAAGAGLDFVKVDFNVT